MFTKEWYKTHPHPRAMLGKKHRKESIDKMIVSRTGLKRDEIARKHIAEGKLGEKNPMWKEHVGRSGIHEWVRRHKPKPEFCVDCNIKKPIDLANISQEYKRDINDFEWLCRRCHMLKDGRLGNLKNTQFKKGENHLSA